MSTFTLTLTALLACFGARQRVDDTEDTRVEADADTDADSDSDSDADSDADSDSDADTDPISDPWEGLSADSGCDEVSGQEVPGATSYFWGDFELGGDQSVSGSEGWLLLANTGWIANGGSDCQVVWNATGTQGDATAMCASCDYSLSLSMQVDAAATTCPEGIYEGDESFSVTYNVDADGDQTTYYFASSGGTLGAGQTDEVRTTYTSASKCVYWGR